MTTAEIPADDYPSRWAALTVLLLANFMNLIDVTIVNVALPSIQQDTGATATQLEWVAAAYVLAFAVGLLPFGRFGDIFGRRRLFLWGLSGFTLGSALCGIAPDIGTLIAARALQGIAGAMMVPQVLAILHVIFRADEKARVFGMVGTITSLGAVAGPVLGGAIIAVDFWSLDWRPIFLINLPLGGIALVAALRLLPVLPRQEDATPDWLGMALFGVAITLIVLPLIEGRTFDWPWWTFAAMIAAIPVGALFLWWEHLRSRSGASALMPASLLSNGAYLSNVALVTLFFSGVPGMFLMLAIFFQSGFGLTPLESGLATVPFPVGVMIASTVMGRLLGHWHDRRIFIGAATLTVGMTLMHLTVLATGDTLGAIRFALPLFVCGLGMGTAIPALFETTLSTVAGTDAGAGSGAMQAFQQAGAVLGIAIVSQLFFPTLGPNETAVATASRETFVEAAALGFWWPILAFAGLALFTGLRFSLRRMRG
ncbi:MFS transporter [Jannaschia rubra]|uniref:MFS transporter n=1 Tax=Jannaschia rubra TaxID=282197 RepID=UPI0024938000|nr:MFS transporter [Jannaschia rubra]